MKDKKKKSPKSTQRNILIALCVVLALLLAVMLFVTVYLEVMFGRINRPGKINQEQIGDITRATESMPEDFTGVVVDPEDVDMPSGPAESMEAEHIVNILLIGQDARPGEDTQRSDSMILCSFNKNTKTLTMTSFLRDMYVTIPGYWNDKLNHSYRYGAIYGDGAFKLLDETLEYNFGVQIDGNVEVNFTGFVDVIEAVGGVDIYLTSDEADYINGSGYSNLVEGMNHLDGDQALTYARIRYLDSDFGRANRQRTVLMALLDKIKTLSITEMNSLLMELLPLVTTDMSNSEIIGYALELFPMLTDATIVNQQIPAEGTYELGWTNDMSVIFVDFDANCRILKETIGN